MISCSSIESWNTIFMWNTCSTGFGRTFLMLYVVDILILGIKIYIDKSWQLKGLSKIALIVKDLKKLKIKDFERVILSNTT